MLVSSVLVCALASSTLATSVNRRRTEDYKPGAELSFPKDFLFGASSAATQIEEGNKNTDWWWYGLPESEGGAGKLKTPVGDAAMGYSLWTTDVNILAAMHLNSYRFSIEWGRVWPNGPDADYDKEALAHYRKQILDMKDAGVKPMVTIHHFSNPIWTEDFLHPQSKEPKECTPTKENMCGWAGPNQPAIIAALVKHTELLATELGDIVDNWCTINEPVNYIMAGWGMAAFPPGHSYMLDGHFNDMMDVFEGFLEAHSQMYDALKKLDTKDADGDGVPAFVGNTLSVSDWQPVRANKPSTDPEDVAAAERVDYVYNHFFTMSIRNGEFDRDWSSNKTTMEAKPHWKGKLDFVGIQYYFRAGVTSQPALLAAVAGTPCMPGSGIDMGSCLPPPEDPNHWIPAMGYEYWEQGLYNILTAYKDKYPDMPTIVTESGIAANNGVRRSEHVVRNLEQIHRAINDGADVRGYFHWSLTDNFEWAEGYDPHFGLYRMADPYNGDYSRIPTAGAYTYKQIMQDGGKLTTAVREKYGGYGPMTPETDEAGDFPDAPQPEDPLKKPPPSVQAKPEAGGDGDSGAGGGGAESCDDADTVSLMAYMGDCSGEAIVTTGITTDGKCLDVMAMGMQGSASIEKVDGKLIGKVYMGAACQGDPLVTTGPLEAGDKCNAAAPASVKVSCKSGGNSGGSSGGGDKPAGGSCAKAKKVSLEAFMGDCSSPPIVTTDISTDGECLDVQAMGMDGSAKMKVVDGALVGEVYIGKGCPGDPMVTTGPLESGDVCNAAAPASVKIKCDEEGGDADKDTGKPEETTGGDKPDGGAAHDVCATAKSVTLNAFMGGCDGAPIVTSDITTDGKCLDVTAMGMEGSAKISVVDGELIGHVYMGSGCPEPALVTTDALKSGGECNAAAPAAVTVDCPASKKEGGTETEAASTRAENIVVPAGGDSPRCSVVKVKGYVGTCGGDALLEADMPTDGKCIELPEGFSAKVTKHGGTLQGQLFRGQECPEPAYVTLDSMKVGGLCNEQAPAAFEVLCY